MLGEFAGKRIVVMGLGRFGGGTGVARWLCRQGAHVHVTDLAGADALADSIQSLAGLDVSYRLGGHDEADLEACDLLVVNPGVDKRKSSFFQAAVARGVAWTSEMNLFLERCPGRVVGITGTVGKSTTTAMIGTILDAASGGGVGRPDEAVRGSSRRSASPDAPSPCPLPQGGRGVFARSAGRPWRHGRVWLGGNIGKSLLEDLPAMQAHDVVVLELSSFQLEDAAQVRRSPHIALVTNIRDNHLDRHGTLAAYAEAKANIYKYQGPDDWLVLPFEGGVELLPGDWAGRRNLVRFGSDRRSRSVILEFQDGCVDPTAPAEKSRHGVAVRLSVPGLHNVENAAAALAVSTILGVPETMATEALARFPGLAHRLEFVREHRGVKYYNDSKATTPEAAMTSLRAFDCGVVMLLGGSDKGSSFVELGRALAGRAKVVVCMGATSERIRREIRADSVSSAAEGGERVETDRPGTGGPGRRGPIVETASSFQEGVLLASRLAEPGDVVVLSPACASFDWFRNYEHRGETFRELVRSLD